MEVTAAGSNYDIYRIDRPGPEASKPATRPETAPPASPSDSTHRSEETQTPDRSYSLGSSAESRKNTNVAEISVYDPLVGQYVDIQV